MHVAICSWDMSSAFATSVGLAAVGGLTPIRWSTMCERCAAGVVGRKAHRIMATRKRRSAEQVARKPTKHASGEPVSIVAATLDVSRATVSRVLCDDEGTNLVSVWLLATRPLISRQQEVVVDRLRRHRSHRAALLRSL